MKTLSNKTVYVLAVDLGCALSICAQEGYEMAKFFPAGKPDQAKIDLRARFLGNAGPVSDFEVEALTEDGQAFLDLVS